MSENNQNMNPTQNTVYKHCLLESSSFGRAIIDLEEGRITEEEFNQIADEIDKKRQETLKTKYPKQNRDKKVFSETVHFLQCVGSVVLGSALFFLVTAVLVIVFALILYYLAKIPILSFLLNLIIYAPKYLDDGYAQFRMISFIIYIPALSISVFLLEKTVNLICFRNNKAAAIAFKIIACIVIVLHVIFVIYNIVGLFRGTSNYQQIITNAIWIFAGSCIWGLGKD